MTADVEQIVEKAADQAAEVVEKVTDQVAEAAEAAAPESQDTDLIAQVKGIAKEVAGTVEKSPLGAKVVKAAKEMQEDFEKSSTATRMKQTIRDTAETVQKSPLLDTAHKVLLAGVGAAALAQDEVEDFVNRLVERGEIAESDGKKMVKDVLEKRKQAIKLPPLPGLSSKRLSDDVEKRIAAAIERMNIPTKDEIEALSAKITTLTKKVDELKKSS